MTSRRRAGDLRYASAPKRREEILRRMRGAGYVSAPDLSADLSVSERTVRRDLQKLAELGLVDLVYGGALAPGGAAPGSPFGARAQAHSRQKRAIAAEALRFIGPGATIGIDAGTTTVELVRMLPADGQVTVITHSLPAMGLMGERGDGTLIGVGGLHHPGTQSFAGPDAVAAIGRLRVHTFFLAASGLDQRGVYCGTPHDAEVKQAFVAIADHVVLLADSSKLRQIAPIPICGYEAVDTVVTDNAVSKPDRAALAARTTIVTVKV